MVIVNRCCCCISLRKGTLIPLWLSAFGGLYYTFAYEVALVNPDKVYGKLDPPYNTLVTINLLVCLISSIVSFITAILGINGVQKNLPKYLTPYLYYTGSVIVHLVVFMSVALFYPDLYTIILTFGGKYVITKEMGVALFSCSLALQTYLFIVIKSCRDSMPERASDNSIELTSPCP